MNHQQAQDSFLDLLDGRLLSADEAVLLGHLSQCASCNEAFEGYRRVVALQHRLASVDYPLERGFGGAVMSLIEQEEARADEVVESGTQSGPVTGEDKRSSGGKMWSVAAVSGVLVLYILLSRSAAPIDASEAAYEDSLVRGAVGNLFELIEGSFGALLLLSLILAAIISAVAPLRSMTRRITLSGGFAAAACCVFCLRALVGLFFGDNYQQYDAAGRSNTGPARVTSYSETTLKAAPPRTQTTQQSGHGSYVGQQSPPYLGEQYAPTSGHRWQQTSAAPVSTFAIDVDTGSYSNVRRFLLGGSLPPADAVRIEEMVNYFTYDYPAPEDGPFSVTFELAPSPVRRAADNVQLLRVGIRAKAAPSNEDQGWNLVFLIDVSGSMRDENKLPLLKSSLQTLVSKLRPQDRLAIVTYASSSRVALESTSGAEKERIMQVIDRLVAGGNTNGEAGIQTAYAIAARNRIPGGVNRVIMATDGDFNVGLSSYQDLLRLVEENKRGGVSLSTLGFGIGNLREDNLEQLADKGDGSYFYIDSLREAERIFSRKLASIIEDVAKDVKIQLELNPAHVREYRLLGFQNRALTEAEFSNDSVDGGEIGSGHTMTALYELRLNEGSAAESNRPEELGFIKLRFKDLTGSRVSKLELPITTAQLSNGRAPSPDFKLAAAASAFGLMLRNEEAVDYSWSDVERVANESAVADHDGERAELVDLVRRAASLRGSAVPESRRYE